ncbi:restriction endonuclease subunit S [Bacteroides gallinaceum]|uniref:Restriction endonuclease subunit S n=1 Tax=Bacteroides gallinaceum TaxID=1462571 RepID=A0ABT7X1A5_9BACE|nr:restriction endonuclease subunit S [Bacteroides gallinaceum]MDN0047863.1 restriction endonuclease subunit S [Bacteroides gallinaceum]
MNKGEMKRLGDYIREVDVRNRDLEVTNLLGLSMTKQFRPSTSNIVGVDLSKYKIVHKDVFAFDTMSVIRVHKVPIAINLSKSPIIVSPAYITFECKDSNILNPNYLMMWFSRDEFDRYADFKSDAAVRGGYNWEELCDTPIYLPPIEQQQKIVSEYEAITRRIHLNEQIIAKLEETAQTLYRKMFVDGIDKENLPEGWRMGTLGEICCKIGSGATPKGGKECYINIGTSFIRSMNVLDLRFNHNELARITLQQAKILDSVSVESKDILLNITGVSVARCCMVPDSILPARVNQHVMIIRPNKIIYSYYLLLLLYFSKEKLLGISQSGSTREAITKSEIERFTILVPSMETVCNFDHKVSSLFQYEVLLEEENNKLNELHSLLLAKIGQ